MSERHHLLPIVFPALLPDLLPRLLPRLLPILRRVRRRRRALASLQGAVVGAAAALALGAGWMAVAHWLGGKPSLATIAAAVLAVATVSAAAWGLRPVSLQRCARILDGAGVGQDRVLTALELARQHAAQAGTQPGTVDAFVVAAIQDAAERAALVPLARAAPLTRPRGVAVLAVGGAAVVVLGLMPWPRDDGRAQATASVKAPAAARLARLTPDALDGERDEARAALAAGRAAGDKTLTDLATELAAAIKALTYGGLERGDALDRLAALQRRAEAAARQAEELGEALARAGAALNETPGTRGLGQGLTSGDAAATGKAASELSARADAASGEQRAAMATALERAAERAGAAPPSAGGGQKGGQQGQSGQSGESGEQERRRRLQDPRAASDNSNDGGPSQGGKSERHLERLERDLRDTASACRDNPAACARKLNEAAQSLPRMQQQARNAQARQRLQSAVEQLRERLRREGDSGSGQARDRERQRRERQFARAARGQGKSGDRALSGPQQGEGEGSDGQESSDDPGQEGSDDPRDEGGDSLLAQGQGQGAGQGQQAAGGDQAGEQGESASQGSGNGAGESAGSDTGGEGVGNQNGSDPLGRGRDLSSTRGREQQARVQSGAGPRRSQVIEAAAARGFAHGDYRGVYRDYDAVVEESLDASAVPPGQRYLVRRYFQLIRPRATPPPRPPQSGAK